MATIRQWLTEAGFNFGNGIILFQPVDKWAVDAPGWGDSNIRHGVIITTTHPILDKRFKDGFGGPECPRFVAKDDEAIYFPAQYDGATWIEKVYTDITRYVNEPTPYPGG